MNLIELFKDEVHLPEDNTCLPWYIDDWGVIHYNRNNNIRDLIEGSGSTYSGFVKYRIDRQGFMMCLIDSQQGWDYQAFFNLEYEVNPDEEYWEDEDD